MKSDTQIPRFTENEMPAQPRRPGPVRATRAAIVCWRRAAGRPVLALVLVALTSLGASLLVGLPRGIRPPVVRDELAYVLGARTFALGRWTNPPHPLWQHFEVMGVIHQPTYSSKYPPGQSALLALGIVCCGQPLAGVWLGVAFMAAAVTWMLRAFVPARWALLGGFLSLVQVGLFGYWGNSYWGGALAAAGGALLFGAARRLWERFRVQDSLLLVLGLAILASTRQVEGLVVSVPVALLLLARLVGRGRPSWREGLTRLVLPVTGGLVLVAAPLLYLNRQVTGDPLRMPYQVHMEAYRAVPLHKLASERPVPEFNHERMRRIAVEDHEERYRSLTPLAKLRAGWGLYVGWALIPALLALPWLLRNRWILFALIVLALLALTLHLLGPFHPHYAAPGAGLLFLLIVEGLRRLRRLRFRGVRIGSFLVPAILVATFPSAAFTYRRHMPDPPRYQAEVLRRLDQEPGRQLVIVEYGADYPLWREWIANEPDIDGAHIVWAQLPDQDPGRRLDEYFADRTVWSLELTERSHRLTRLRGPVTPR